MEKKQILLPSKKYFKAPDEDLDIRLTLDESRNLLKEGDRDVILDVSEQYDKERNESKKYKIYGKIKMVFSNFYSGTTEYTPLKKNLYLVGDGSDNNFTGFLPYNEFAFLRNDVLIEKNIPYTGNTIINFSQNLSTNVDTNGHITITPMSAPYHNWNIYLTYVYGSDNTYPIKYTLSGNTIYDFLSGDGIPFRVTSDNTHYILTSPVEHGMVSGEFVTLSGLTLNNTIHVSGRTFNIDSVGNEIYNSEKYVINILKSQVSGTTSITNGSVMLGKRCLDITRINESTSKYYIHKHKVLTNTSEYIMDRVGFELPIWEEERKLVFKNSNNQFDYFVQGNRMESILFDFKNPFVLTGLTNNLGYTPTEVYATLIFRNGNGYFDYPPKVGYRLNFHDTWIDQHFSGTTSIETGITYNTYTNLGYTFKTGNTLTTGTTLIGAFVEYNEDEMKERIISESYHKFTSPTNIFNHGQSLPSTYLGASADNMIGLYYQPHYRIKLRELSPYVETSKTTEVYNLPDNAKYYQNEGLWKWRDLYDHGYIDPDGFGTEHPFMNGIHYVKSDISFYLRNELNFRNKQDGLIKFRNKSIDC